MHRNPILELLRGYQPRDQAQCACRDRVIAFVLDHPNCHQRSLAVGHLAGSAWLTNQAGTHVLLTHHRKLDRWLQLGGHADGDPDLLAVALREAKEESGIADIGPVSPAVFDVDVHEIPTRGDVPSHLHYDIRFLLRVEGNDRFRVSNESLALAWLDADDFAKLATDESVQRMWDEWRGMQRVP